jgi:hypothetical protein
MPDRRDRLAFGARQFHRDEGADSDANDKCDLPPIFAGGGDMPSDVVDIQDRWIDPRGNYAANRHVG